MPDVTAKFELEPEDHAAYWSLLFKVQQLQAMSRRIEESNPVEAKQLADGAQKVADEATALILKKVKVWKVITDFK